MKKTLEIKSIFGEVLFSYECEENTIAKTVEKAVQSHTNLTYADLSYTDLRNANLSYTNLTYSDLRNADLRYADLSYTNLTYADLSYTDLRNANLSYSNLRNANLSYTNLRYADLRYAKNWQNTEWAKQSKQNILFVLSYLKYEIPALKQKLMEGKINGTQYDGKCCCLIGSLSKNSSIGNVCDIIPFYTKGLHNFGEQLFYQIREGDTPEKSEFAKLAVELCDMALGVKPKKIITKEDILKKFEVVEDEVEIKIDGNLLENQEPLK